MAGNDEQAVRAAVDQWFVTLNAMLNGDPGPFAEIYSHGEDVTYMGADWKAQADKSTGGEVHGADIHIVVHGDMAVAQHLTQGRVRKPDGEMADTSVRETSVFRSEGGVWKMIAHHADGLPYWEKALK